jgi:hypothetical protein
VPVGAGEEEAEACVDRGGDDDDDDDDDDDEEEGCTRCRLLSVLICAVIACLRCVSKA